MVLTLLYVRDDDLTDWMQTDLESPRSKQTHWACHWGAIDEVYEIVCLLATLVMI